MIVLARENAMTYLNLILHSETLSANFKFSIDYTYATAAFSVIFLLKVTKLFAESSDDKVLEYARKLQEILITILGVNNTYIKAISICIKEYTEETSNFQVNYSEFFENNFPFDILNEGYTN